MRALLLLPLGLQLACSGPPPATEPPPPSAQPEPSPVTETPAPSPGETPSSETSSRPEADVARDAARRPQEVMDFFGISEGQTVVELMSGRGYYVDLLSARVGETGKVYAQNNAFVLERFAEADIAERVARLPNASRFDAELDAMELPANLDAVMIVLFYHDTYWQEVEREKMNAAVFAALKPGGVYGVVDHHAEAGSGDRDVKTLHRVDAELVKKEILAAGFELEAESDLLAHPEDDRKTNVFKMRGKTDRFVLRFRKPAG